MMNTIQAANKSSRFRHRMRKPHMAGGLPGGEKISRLHSITNFLAPVSVLKYALMAIWHDGCFGRTDPLSFQQEPSIISIGKTGAKA
jgi:hypothetical protein